MLGELLARQVDLASDGSPWHGPGLLDNLGSITAQQAAARPLATTHSIWELVLHLTGWTREVARRLDGAPKAAPPEGDWPAVSDISQRSWEKAREGLLQAHRDLAAKIRRFPDSRWNDAVAQPAGSSDDAPTSFAETVAGLLQHDAYHSGQIGLLRKALGISS